MFTGDNNRFLRYWFEVSNYKIGLNLDSDGALNNNYKWIPYNKGGLFRKWFGNHEYLINWENNGEELKNFDGSGINNVSYFFREAISWSRTSTGNISFRYFPKGFLFDSAGCCIFYDSNKDYLIGFLNSSIAQEFLDLISPTLNYEVGQVSSLPIIKNNSFDREIIISVRENIELCKNDWDDYETSWNFKTNPLVRYKNGTLSESFDAWQEHKQDDFNHLKSNEVRLNEIFAKIYSMDVECDVEDKHVSIVRADYEKDIKDLISYAVGCMFGRYSLDDEGLICADDNFNQDNYSTIIPDTDAILPILDTEYFEDDIVEKFIEFIKITFGKEHLEENLEFIAGALHKSGNTSTDQIRNYFLNDFFKDHTKKYKKRPIYWQFNSGKQKGFRCLIYLHRYNPSTVARIRTDYLHKTQKAIEDNIERCDNIIESNSTKKSDKTKAQKEKNKLIKQLEETRLYDEALAHIANQQIDLDLDDGVKVNYEKFQNIPVETESQKTKNINLLTKI